jgi:hypothetical protein
VRWMMWRAISACPQVQVFADAGIKVIVEAELTGRGLHSFPFQLNLSSSVHRIIQINS